MVLKEDIKNLLLNYSEKKNSYVEDANEFAKNFNDFIREQFADKGEFEKIIEIVTSIVLQYDNTRGYILQFLTGSKNLTKDISIESISPSEINELVNYIYSMFIKKLKKNRQLDEQLFYKLSKDILYIIMKGLEPDLDDIKSVLEGDYTTLINSIEDETRKQVVNFLFDLIYDGIQFEKIKELQLYGEKYDEFLKILQDNLPYYEKISNILSFLLGEKYKLNDRNSGKIIEKCKNFNQLLQMNKYFLNGLITHSQFSTAKVLEETVPLVEIFRLMADCGCLTTESQPTYYDSKLNLETDYTMIHQQISYVDFFMTLDNYSLEFLKKLFLCNNFYIRINF